MIFVVVHDTLANQRHICAFNVNDAGLVIIREKHNGLTVHTNGLDMFRTYGMIKLCVGNPEERLLQ